ncbi:MAG: class F sortase [Candidatus Saccharimonadales bacterium]
MAVIQRVRQPAQLIADVVIPKQTPTKTTEPVMMRRVMDIIPAHRHAITTSNPHPLPSQKLTDPSGANIDDIIMEGFIYPKARRSVGVTLIYMMAGLIFCVGLSSSIYSIMTTKKAEQQVLAIAKTVTDEGVPADSAPPSEQKPPADTSRYVVAPNLPRIISIPSLGVSARVTQVGVDKNNAMRVPANIYDAAWYNGSNTLGQPGAVVINGHVSGPTAHGVFYSLKNIKNDQQIIVERGDGQKFIYVVRRVETVKVTDLDMNKVMVPYEAGAQGLNLITCGGGFDPKTSQYDSRVLVFAVAI